MTNSFFNSKEDYLLFRSNFAAAVNHQNAKSKLTPCDEWIRATDTFSEGTGNHREKGWMTGAHFIFLNIVRGRDLYKGFTPITNPQKLKNSPTIWNGFDIAVDNLITIASYAQNLRNDVLPDSYKAHLDKFIEPLLGTGEKNSETYYMYVNVLAKMASSTPKYEKYHTDFGIGGEILDVMVKNALAPKNYEEFMQIVGEIENVQKEKILSAA